MLKELTVNDFINETASDSPAPGGGSIAALTAASAAALLEMVSNLTIGKKGYEGVGDKMDDIKKTAREYRTKFLNYIDEDSASFNAIMTGFKMPKDSNEEKRLRQEYLQAAFKKASKVPFDIGCDAYKLFDIAKEVVKYGNKNTVTDGLVAAINLRAAVKSAFYNVKINLGSIKDQEFVVDLKNVMNDIETKVDAIEKEILNMADL